MKGVSHTVEVTAATLYEAVAHLRGVLGRTSAPWGDGGRCDGGMRRLDPLFAAQIASIRLANAEIKAYNLRIVCGE
jgi:hypothetical protein